MNGVIWMLIVGGLAGFLAGKIMRGRGYGVIADILIGICGGIVGGMLFGVFGVASIGIIGSLVTATVGAVVLIWIVRQLRSV
jgi:uncharacterized membrane protein YeaQ/YmgE (transglycosylase-associated protein family)